MKTDEDWRPLGNFLKEENRNRSVGNIAWMTNPVLYVHYCILPDCDGYEI